MKLQVVVDKVTPRIQYAFDILLRTVLGWDYVLVAGLHKATENPLPALYYGKNPASGMAFLPSCGLLEETGVRGEVPPFAEMEGYPGAKRLFPFEGGQADWAAAAFYLATDYEKYAAYHPDAHGRYEESAYPSASWGIWEYPLVHVYAWEVAALLVREFPHLQWDLPQALPAIVTLDVDFPWKYLHKPFWMQLGGGVKDIREGRMSDFRERVQSLISMQDPYHTFAYLQALLPPARTLTFFLIERRHNNDSRFTWRLKAYRNLIRHWQEAGYRCGIHPSYLSGEQPESIFEETNRLSGILGQPTRHSRQHFLKYRLPDTYRTLIAAGIQEDYSLCTIQRPGFRCGMARPFAWYDLERETITGLTLVPAQVMDRTLLSYLHLTPEPAMYLLGATHAATRRWGGQFVLLMHNDAFSESDPWQGWKEPLSEMIRLVLDA